MRPEQDLSCFCCAGGDDILDRESLPLRGLDLYPPASLFELLLDISDHPGMRFTANGARSQRHLGEHILISLCSIECFPGRARPDEYQDQGNTDQQQSNCHGCDEEKALPAQVSFQSVF